MAPGRSPTGRISAPWIEQARGAPGSRPKTTAQRTAVSGDQGGEAISTQEEKPSGRQGEPMQTAQQALQSAPGTNYATGCSRRYPPAKQGGGLAGPGHQAKRVGASKPEAPPQLRHLLTGPHHQPPCWMVGAEPGDLVQPGQAVLTLGNLNEIQVMVEVADTNRQELWAGPTRPDHPRCPPRRNLHRQRSPAFLPSPTAPPGSFPWKLP